MKYIWLIILISFTVNAENRCFNKESYINYYFINGVWNLNIQQAIDGSNVIRRNILKNQKEVQTLYNPHKDYLADIIEVLLQKSLEVEYLKAVKQKSENPNLVYQKEQYLKITSLVKDFLNTISSNKQNVIFAHSQGNLFANEMCDLKEDQKIEIVSFAPPTFTLKCNLHQNYALFDNDKVIDALGSKFKKTISPNFIDKSKNNGSDHHELVYYLNDSEVVDDMTKLLVKTQDEIYSRDYAFPLIELKIKPNSILRNLSNTYDQLSESVDLWSREKKAYYNAFTFLSNVINPKNSLLSKKGISEALKAEIPAKSEEEFVDVLAFSFNAASSYCNQVFKGTKLLNACKGLASKKDYFNSKEIKDPKFIIQNKEDSYFLSSCKDFGSLNYDSFAPIPVQLKFTKTAPTIELNVLENKEEIELKYSSDREKTLSIGEMNFDIKDGEIHFSFNKADLKIDPYQPSEEYKKCNSLSKLSSNDGCFTYFQKLEKQYFQN